MADHPDRVPLSARQRRGFRWAWAGLFAACFLVAAVTLTAVAYPFRYVNDWMPLTANAKAVALAHEARAVAASIQDPLGRSRVLAGQVEYSIFPGIAEVLARAGRRGEAIQVAREALTLVRELQKEDSGAGSTQSRGWYLAVVAQTFAYIGEPSEAVSIARTLHGDDRLVAFAAIIDAEARSRRTAQAAALMPELISAARRTKGDWQLRYYLGDVNPTLAQTGLHRELQTETDAILAVTKTALDRDALRRDVAQDLARAGRVAEALLMARAVEDPVQRVEAFAEMGQGLARAGRREDALHVIDEALAAARALPDAYSRARSMSGVAEALADVGRSVDAVSVAREARETARRAKYDVDVIVVHVAPALAHAGKVPEAVKALYEVRDRADWSFDHQVDNLVGVLIYSGRLAEALAVAETAPNANRRIVRLNTVARALVKDGQKAAAIRATREALDLTSRLHKPELVDVANAAVTLARAGAKTEALRVVRQAVASLGQGRGEDGSQYDRRKGLVTLAQALALAGDRREALRVVRRAQDQSWPAGLEDGPEQEVAVIVDTAEAGAVAAAVDLARAIPFPAERAQALTAVASVVLHDQPFPLCCKWLP